MMLKVVSFMWMRTVIQRHCYAKARVRLNSECVLLKIQIQISYLAQNQAWKRRRQPLCKAYNNQEEQELVQYWIICHVFSLLFKEMR